MLMNEYFKGILKFEIINENINIMITRLISYSYYKVSLYSSFCFCRVSYFMINYAKSPNLLKNRLIVHFVIEKSLKT